MTTPRVEFAGFSDAGPVRARNEDRWLAEPARGLFAVIDGMGGHAGGAEAAEIAATSLREAASPADGLMLANRRIYEAVQASPAMKGMGCVATAVTLDARGLTVTHVGDTAALLVTAAGAEVLTARHTRAGELQASHVLADDEAAALGVSNQLLRDVGGQLREDRAWFDVSEPIPVEPGDLLFLCSDGVHGPLSHAELVGRLREARAASTSLDALAREIVALAIARGGRDNATAVVVRLLAPDAATRPVHTVDDSLPPVAPPPPAPTEARPTPIAPKPATSGAKPEAAAKPVASASATARSWAILMLGVLIGVAIATWAVMMSRAPVETIDDPLGRPLPPTAPMAAAPAPSPDVAAPAGAPVEPTAEPAPPPTAEPAPQAPDGANRRP
jgi:serine/threonine protein phosphatase PrpC